MGLKPLNGHRCPIMVARGKATLLDLEFNGGLFSLSLSSISVSCSPSLSYGPLPMFLTLCTALYPSLYGYLSLSVSFSCLCVVCLPPHTSVYLSVSLHLSFHAWGFLSNHPSCLCLSVCLQLLDSVSLSTSLPMFCCPHISLSLPTIHSLPLISCLPSSGAGGPATDAGETRAGSLGAEEAG